MMKIGRFNKQATLIILALVGVLFATLTLFSSRQVSPGTSTSSYLGAMTEGDFAYAPQAAQQGQQGSSRGSGSQQGQMYDEITAADVEANLTTQERVIIRTATLRIVVSDTQASLDAIAGLAGEFGGWVVNSNINRVNTPSGEEAVRGSITVRVVAERLDEALAQIKSSAISVESEAVSGQDVTQQYVDLTSRLHNMQAAETQLQSILDDARRTEDVLSVYNELVRVRGEIETLQGQIQYFSESAAFSSISVELVPQALLTPIQIAGWTPEGTARSAFLALLNVLRFAVDVVITLIVLVLPVVLIFGVPAWWVYRRVRRRVAANVTQP